MHQRADGDCLAVKLEQVRTFVGTRQLVAEIGEHRSFILPRHVALERFLRGEERHGRHRIHIGLVGAGPALWTARKPAVCTLYADARRRGGHSINIEFGNRQIRGGHHVSAFRINRLAGHAGFHLRITEIEAKTIVNAQRDRRFDTHMHAILTQAGGLVFSDGRFVSASLQVPG